jgi:hypothetical protein
LRDRRLVFRLGGGAVVRHGMGGGACGVQRRKMDYGGGKQPRNET